MATNRTTAVIHEALERLLFGFIVSSLTIDNDIGFVKWKELEVILKTPIHFCHPFHSWVRSRDGFARPCELFCERSETKEPQGVQLP